MARAGDLTLLLTTALLIKIVCSILVALIAIYAAEHLGPVWGGMIAGIPSTVGPAYIILAIDYGDAFVADSALASAAAMVATFLFPTAAALAARRINPWFVLPITWAVWATAAVAVKAVTWTLPLAVGANLVVFIVAVAATHRIATEPVEVPAVVRRWYDLFLRAILAGCFVGFVTAASAFLGPTMAGILTMFPIVFSTLCVILLSRMGGRVAAATFANCIWPMLPLPLALGLVHMTAVPWGSAIALSLGLAICIGWNAALILWRHTRPAPAL